MHLKISNDADKLAIVQVLNWDEDKNYAMSSLLAGVVENHMPEDDDELMVDIAKAMLPYTYRGNPSMLGKQLFERIHGKGFHHCFGGELNEKFVRIGVSRQEKPNKKFTVKFSIKQHLRSWIDSTDRLPAIEVATNDIPDAYVHRPEQLVYQFKRETGIKLKIKKLKSKWLFTVAS